MREPWGLHTNIICVISFLFGGKKLKRKKLGWVRWIHLVKAKEENRVD